MTAQVEAGAVVAKGFRAVRVWPFLVSWVVYPTLWPAGALAALLHVAHTGRRAGWGWAAAVALLSPPALVSVVAFGGGAHAYASGQPYLLGVGLPGPEYTNCDPVLRCPWASSGCVVDGSEVFSNGARNLAIALCTRAFGPASGTYTGAYPTRAEAFALLASAREKGDARRFTLGDLARDPRAAGFSGALAPGFDERFKTLFYRWWQQYRQRSPFEDGSACAYVSVPLDGGGILISHENGAMPMAVFDGATGRAVAVYVKP